MPRETSLTERIINYAKKQGCLARKVHGSAYGTGGWPDVEILLPVSYQNYAVPLYVEVKQPGNTPKERQKKRLRDLTRFKAVAVWVDNLEDLKKVIEAIRDNRSVEDGN